MADTNFELIKDIFELYSVIPNSNADVERGFSTMNRIKTKLRNKMDSGNVDGDVPNLRKFMIIKLIGPDYNQY